MKRETSSVWPWFSLGWQSARLGLEMQRVVALRLARIAGGGASAQREATLMVTEKIGAFAEAQALMLHACSTGDADRAAKRLLALYSRRVKANRRRLSR